MKRLALSLLVLTAGWLGLVTVIRPQVRQLPQWPRYRPVSLADLADGAPLSTEELFAWRDIVAHARSEWVQS